MLTKKWRHAKPKLPSETEVTIVANATHCFDEDGAEEKLFRETLRWIKQH
jgi:hypothetical protein